MQRPTGPVLPPPTGLIQPYIRRTPSIELDPAEFDLDCASVTLKLEFLQHTGSFKVRGAFVNLLTQPVPEVGVVAASGGNHGAAVSYAAYMLGVPATIFVPSVASPAKLARIRSFGADLIITDGLYADALLASEAHLLQASAAWRCTPTTRRRRCAGQGTVALELEAPGAPQLDTRARGHRRRRADRRRRVLVRGHRIRVVGVEPETAPTMAQALAAGDAGGCGGRRRRRRLAGAAPGRRPAVRHRA